MKTTFLSMVLAGFAWCASAQSFINLGSTANDGTGDKLRAAGILINTNFYAIFQSNLNAYTTETTRNAAVSNAVVSLETTRNAAVSNSAVTFAMTVSNAIAAAFQIIDTELTEWSGISTNRFLTTNATPFLAGISNNVRVAAGTGGITVTPSGSGGVMTYTINDDDAGSGGSTPGGNSGAVQYADGGAFDGDANKYYFDETNRFLRVLNGAPDAVQIGVNYVASFPNGLNLGGGGRTNWTIGNTSTGHLVPNGTNANDVGSWANPVRTNWATYLHTASGGAILSEGALVMLARGMTLVGSNMWATGAVSQVYSNVFAANAGGLTNILISDLLDGQMMHIKLWASNGVTVGLPQFAASDYIGGRVIRIGTNCWTDLYIDRMNTRTNVLVLTLEYEVVPGTGITITTNDATAQITINSSGPTSSNNIPFTAYSMITGSPTTNILINASLGTLFRVLLTNSISGFMMTNGYDGQELSVESYQSGLGNHTATFVPNTGGALTNNVVFGEDITFPLTLTTNAYRKDLIKLRYEVTSLATNTSRSNWCVIGMLRKYGP